jgi:hypothetical protein
MWKLVLAFALTIMLASTQVGFAAKKTSGLVPSSRAVKLTLLPSGRAVACKQQQIVARGPAVRPK